MKQIYLAKHDINVFRTTNSITGNPRYIISWTALGLKAYKQTPDLLTMGLRLYRGKNFGGGFIFSTYNLETYIDTILTAIKLKQQCQN